MLQLYAHAFIRLLDDLRQMEAEVRSWDDPDIDVPDEKLESFGEAFASIRKQCSVLELRSAKKQVREIKRHLIPGFKFAEMPTLLQQLRIRVNEDLEDHVFYQVLPDKVSAFFKRSDHPAGTVEELVTKTPQDLFGDQACSNFPSAVIDIEQAAKCLIASRNTACVFHLMRVMEVTLRSLATSLKDPNLDPKRNPSWDSILKKCRDELLAKTRDKRSPEWQSDDAFFSEATVTLMAVKDAWRNPTMHVEIHYDEEQAMDIWRSVRMFVRHLATKLHEI